MEGTIRKGACGERIAALYLGLAGYRVLETNYRSGHLESERLVRFGRRIDRSEEALQAEKGGERLSGGTAAAARVQHLSFRSRSDRSRPREGYDAVEASGGNHLEIA